MAALHSNLLLSSSVSPSPPKQQIKATLHVPKELRFPRPSIQKLPTSTNLVGELNKKTDHHYAAIHTRQQLNLDIKRRQEEGRSLSSEVVAELYAIMDAVADRVEMHNSIEEQRNNWNNLLLTSINAITVTAATMAGLAAIGGAGAPLLALKLSSTLMYSAATAVLLVMNKIQPSQLAEEQRNAARLFKQLHRQIQTTLELGNPTCFDVNDTLERVFALDKAYPLPLLGGVMLDKFPETVKPAVWWPQQHKQQQQRQEQQRNLDDDAEYNGWSLGLEEEMKEIAEVLKKKDTAEYVRLSKLVLKVNRILAISGPLLTGIAAIGSDFVGSSSLGPWPALLGVVSGALANVVNTVEHGGQVGMVFEMYRNCAGSFQLLQESIESALGERELGRRENGRLLETKVALQLGRSLSQLRKMAASSLSGDKDARDEEFASTLF